MLAYAEWTLFNPYFDILLSQKLLETVYLHLICFLCIYKSHFCKCNLKQIPKWDDLCAPCTENLRSTLYVCFGESESLTDNLDDLSQQHSVAHILLQVSNQPLVSRFGQVVVRPVRVDLSTRNEKVCSEIYPSKKFHTTRFTQARLREDWAPRLSRSIQIRSIVPHSSYSAPIMLKLSRLTSQKSPFTGAGGGRPRGSLN